MGAAFHEFAHGLEPGAAWAIVAIAAAIAVFLLWQAFRALRRARLVEDTPTSLIRSAAQGYCELFGHGELMPGPPIRAPLSGATCLWWEYSIEEKVRSGKNTHWRTLEADVSGSIFALDDPTGRCLVDPDGAEVIGPAAVVWYGDGPRPLLGPDQGARWGLGHRYRYSQRVIPTGTLLLAMGTFETVGDPHASLDAQREVAAKLTAWKRDPAALKARFDADRDGQVDLQEWEAARLAAQREVQAELADQALSPGVHLMRDPRDDRPYILTTYDQETLAGRRRWVARFALLGSALCAWFALALFVARGG
jgi:hypothetical protein